MSSLDILGNPTEEIKLTFDYFFLILLFVGGMTKLTNLIVLCALCLPDFIFPTVIFSSFFKAKIHLSITVKDLSFSNKHSRTVCGRNGPQSGPESVEEESSKTNFCKNLSQK